MFWNSFLRFSKSNVVGTNSCFPIVIKIIKKYETSIILLLFILTYTSQDRLHKMETKDLYAYSF